MQEIKFNVEDAYLTNEVLNFIRIAKQCVVLYSHKNHDYGNSFTKGMNEIGAAYGLSRLYDKVNRLVNLYKSNNIAVDESIEDTLKDLACYSIMMLAYYSQYGKNKGADNDIDNH